MFRTRHLIIISGPACAGKSNLINRIRKGELRALSEQIGIGDPLSWIYLEAKDLPEVSCDFVERLVLHYDLHAQYSPSKGFNYLTELMGNSDQVTILTLRVSALILRRRNWRRFMRTFYSLVRRPMRYRTNIRLLRGQWKRYQVYRRPAHVRALYDTWFEFCTARSVTCHWILDVTKEDNMTAQPFEAVKPDMPALLAEELMEQQAAPIC